MNLAYPDAVRSGGVQVPLTASTNEKFGDYQCNAAMPLSQYYKRIGQVCGIIIFIKIIIVMIKDSNFQNIFRILF